MTNNVIAKLSFKPRTLEDPIVLDGLSAISLLKEPLYLVGGVATQSYLPTSCRRPTADVDFSIVRPFNYGDFKLMISPAEEFLRDKGYQTKTKKRSTSYSLDVSSLDHEGLCLEFSRRNVQSFERNKKKIGKRI